VRSKRAPRKSVSKPNANSSKPPKPKTRKYNGPKPKKPAKATQSRPQAPVPKGIRKRHPRKPERPRPVFSPGQGTSLNGIGAKRMNGLMLNNMEPTPSMTLNDPMPPIEEAIKSDPMDTGLNLNDPPLANEPMKYNISTKNPRSLNNLRARMERYKADANKNEGTKKSNSGRTFAVRKKIGNLKSEVERRKQGNTFKTNVNQPKKQLGDIKQLMEQRKRNHATEKAKPPKGVSINGYTMDRIEHETDEDKRSMMKRLLEKISENKDEYAKERAKTIALRRDIAAANELAQQVIPETKAEKKARLKEEARIKKIKNTEKEKKNANDELMSASLYSQMLTHVNKNGLNKGLASELSRMKLRSGKTLPKHSVVAPKKSGKNLFKQLFGDNSD
jgi:hypothetical protein